MDRGTSYLKAISHRTIIEKKLLIPRALVSSVRCLPSSVILRDRYGNIWRVEVVKEGVEWYLGKGWIKLSEENSVQLYDILEFCYKGNHVFDFKLMGQDACEKRGVGGLKLGVKEEEETENEEEEDVTESECSEDTEDTHNNEDDDDYDYDDDDIDIDYDYDEDEHISISTTIKLKSKSKTSRERSGGSSSTIGVGVRVGSKPRRVKRNVLDCYGAEIFKSGLVPRPTNPYFVTRLRAHTRKNDLSIPIDVFKDNKNLTVPKNAFLVDKEGRKWPTEIKKWRDGRLWCPTMWGSFCSENHIKRDDVCICELVQGEGNNEDLYILVHVVEK